MMELVRRHTGQVVILLLAGAALVGCEAVFTSNLFENFARNPENMSEEQLVAYGNDAIASGDVEKMEEAFNALREKTEGSELDADTRDTLVELGLGSTDVVGFIGSNLDDPESIDLSEFSDDKGRIARETAEIMNDAEDGAFSADRYAYAAAGVVLAAGEDADGDFDDISTSDDADLAEELVNKSLAAYEAEGKEDDEVYKQLSSLKDDYL
ncbi:MAG: hypothetical protein ACOC0B_00110 [bacterium]